MKDAAMYERAIKWAKKNGFSQIKANTDDYETPAGFKRVGADEPYIPDVAGIRLGGKSYVEIGLKSEQDITQVSKWKLLSTMAAMKSGQLFLLAPKGHKAYIEKVVKQYNISAKVVSI